MDIIWKLKYVSPKKGMPCNLNYLIEEQLSRSPMIQKSQQSYDSKSFILARSSNLSLQFECLQLKCIFMIIFE